MAPGAFVCQVSHGAGTVPLVVLGLHFNYILGCWFASLELWFTASPSRHCRFRWQLPDLAIYCRFPCFSHLLPFRCSDEHCFTSAREAGDIQCPLVVLNWEPHSMNLLWCRWQTAALWPYQNVHLISKKTNFTRRALPQSLLIPIHSARQWILGVYSLRKHLWSKGKGERGREDIFLVCLPPKVCIPWVRHSRTSIRLFGFPACQKLLYLEFAKLSGSEHKFVARRSLITRRKLPGEVRYRSLLYNCSNSKSCITWSKLSGFTSA